MKIMQDNEDLVGTAVFATNNIHETIETSKSSDEEKNSPSDSVEYRFLENEEEDKMIY